MHVHMQAHTCILEREERTHLIFRVQKSLQVGAENDIGEGLVGLSGSLLGWQVKTDDDTIY